MTSALVAELREIIEAERLRFGVPGCAVAVVADTELLLCDGFGERDTERAGPVTRQTLFPIASATKTFTAALCALLAADGVLDLDRPARDYLPELALADAGVAAQVSVADMLCHRVGLPRHDLLWYTAPAGASRAELLSALRHLELNLPFRSAWQYNNLLYVQAGYLAGRLLGGSFEEAVQGRILDPLGMSRTNLSSAATLADDDHARPYACPGPGEPLREVPMARLDLLAPAGGINSCAEDLARWVLALLGGSADVLPDSALEQLRRPRIALPEHTLLAVDQPVGYGLGTIIEDYRGHRVLHHGGDIDGFTSQVSLLPEAGCAVVFLANRAGTAMRDALPPIVYDLVLSLDRRPHAEQWLAKERALREGGARQAAKATKRDLPMVRPAADYAGRYQHPAYGELTVTVDGGKPRLSCRGLSGVIDHRHLEVFDLAVDLGGSVEHLPVQFFHDLDGEVSAVAVVLEELADPIRFDRVPDTGRLTDELLDRLSGTYRFGPLTAIVYRHGPQGLSAMIIQGEPKELRYVRDLVFRLYNSRVEFTEDGRLICPAGEFTRES